MTRGVLITAQNIFIREELVVAVVDILKTMLLLVMVW